MMFNYFCFAIFFSFVLLCWAFALLPYLPCGHLKFMLLLLWLPCCCNSSQGLRTRYLPTIYLTGTYLGT